MTMFSISSPIDAIREYVSKMDIEMLDLILEDKNTYNKLEKSIFLEQLEAVFNSFKDAGDQRLQVYHGECVNCFKRCRGYTFVGENSAQYLDLLIKEEAGEIKDIFHCSKLQTYKACDKMYPLVMASDQDLEEENDRETSDDDLMRIHACDNALEELQIFRNLSLDVKCVQLWIDRHQTLYEDSVSYFMHEQNLDFLEIYSKLNTLIQIYLCKDKIVSELLQLQNIILNGNIEEKDLLSWLIRNEEIGRSDKGKISAFFSSKEFIDGKIVLHESQELFVSESDFKVFFVYESFFKKYYKHMLKAYSMYTEKEINAIDPNSMEFKNASSLKFNIELRKKKS